MIYLTSDAHHGHEKILEYTNRPYKNTKEMTADIIKKHNEIVDKDDTVFHLGDFLLGDNWKNVASILNRLNGKHHLVIGNHDWLYIWHYIEAGFISVHTSFELDGYMLVHDPAIAGVITSKYFIHGHVHGMGLNISKNCYNVSVEMHNYYPVSFNTIKEYFDSI